MSSPGIEISEPTYQMSKPDKKIKMRERERELNIVKLIVVVTGLIHLRLLIRPVVQLRMSKEEFIGQDNAIHKDEAYAL